MPGSPSSVLATSSCLLHVPLLLLSLSLLDSSAGMPPPPNCHVAGWWSESPLSCAPSFNSKNGLNPLPVWCRQSFNPFLQLSYWLQ